MKRFIHACAVFFIIVSCSNYKKTKPKKLEDSKIVNQVFDKREIHDLQKILSFFDGQIMSSFKGKTLLDSYDLFNEKELELKNEGLIFGNISFSDQQKLNSKIKETTFKEIWDLGKILDVDEIGSKQSFLFINPNGKYISYLKKLGLKNKFIEDYSNIVSQNYDIPPSLVYVITDNYNKIDVSDENIRLMVAIHYLTLNDNFR